MVGDELKAISDKMKSEWNRRVSHDYRFWMSDGHADDTVMWASGERDFEIVTSDLPESFGGQASLLDLGCGVGRLLRPAARRFGRVVGVDVSEAAINQAQKFLQDEPKIELLAGNGFDLASVGNQSIDVVISFAALVSMPVVVVAHYLREIHRILKPQGVFRAQLYFGAERVVAEDNTLHLRCYDQTRFQEAAALAGFNFEWARELNLPFQVSFAELGMKAMVVSLQRDNTIPADALEIASALATPPSAGTIVEEVDRDANDLEYWMTLNYAETLADRGEIDRAKQTLEYAALFSATTTIDVRDLLDRIVHKVGVLADITEAVQDHWSANFDVVQQRWPELAKKLATATSAPDSFTMGSTVDGPVVSIRGQCLDHETKPRAAGEAWARRIINDDRINSADELVVFGFGFGYHLEGLAATTDKTLSVIEPEIGVLVQALRERSLVKLLGRLRTITIGGSEISGIFTPRAELLIRPQSQAIYPELCNQTKAKFYGTRGLTALHPTIAVLGPIQGGSLPITGYTLRALQACNQRVREWDVSGFAPGYHYIDKFFFDRTRSQGVQGVYLEMISQVLLEAVNEKKIDVLICMAQAPISGRVLTELRNRGVVTVLWFMEDFLRFTYWRDLAKYYDFVFTIQRGQCIDEIKRAGAGAVHYLPMACDPGIHGPVELTAEEKVRWGSPVSFVGAGYHNRQQVFASFADMPFKIWGTEWPDCRPFDRMLQESGRRLTPVEYVKIFNSTAINVNLHSSSERDGVDPTGDFLNPRTYELAAAGAFQLVDNRSLLRESFEPEKEIVTYNSVRELKEKIAYYQSRPEERAVIAAAGRARALRDHTYAHRIQEMLSVIYSNKFEELKRREDGSAWRRMLDRACPHEELSKRCQASFARGEEPILDGLVADIVNGKGKLSDTEQKLLFLYHVRKQIIRMKREEMGLNK